METNEQTTNSMQTESEMQMDDSSTQMEATPKSMNNMPECAVIGLIKNHKLLLDEKLGDAKMRFADASLDDENWVGKNERRMECKIIEGQIAMLNKLQSDFECMFTPKTAIAG